MHFLKVGVALCTAQLDLQEAATEACRTSPGSGSTRVCPYRLLRVPAMQPSSRGTARLSSEMSASLPAWMTPSQTPRLHCSDRQQQRQELHQRHMQQQPAP